MNRLENGAFLFRDTSGRKNGFKGTLGVGKPGLKTSKAGLLMKKSLDFGKKKDAFSENASFFWYKCLLLFF